MESAGHVRTRNHREQRLVVAKSPTPEALAHVAVQIDAVHAAPYRCPAAHTM